MSGFGWIDGYNLYLSTESDYRYLIFYIDEEWVAYLDLEDLEEADWKTLDIVLRSQYIFIYWDEDNVVWYMFGKNDL